MILAGQLLLDSGHGKCEIKPGWLRVDDGVIAELALGELPDACDFGGKNALIAPGLIDAHLHLPQFDMIGAHGLPLMRWLSEVTFPAEIKWQKVDYAAAMMRRVVDQLLSKGTTAICGYATVHHASAEVAIEIARASGLRGVVGQVLMDREAPDELCVDANQLLDEAADLVARNPASSRMAAAVTPRFAVSCSMELLCGAGRIAQETGAMIQTHLAETSNECRLVRDLFDGNSYVNVYKQANLLTARSVYGHGIHLDDRDRAELAAAEAVVAHCPTANSFLRSGTMNRAAMIKDGVEVAVGSDIGAGYERSMVRVARSMIEAASTLGHDYPDAATAWYSITAGNADALGWPDAGRLEVGATADLLVIDPTVPWLQRGVDPLSMLMFAWDDRWLRQTFLQGRLAWGG